MYSGTGMMSSEFTKWPENVRIAGPVGYADYSISKNGTLLYMLNLAEKCRHGLRGPYPSHPRQAGGGGNAYSESDDHACP